MNGLKLVDRRKFIGSLIVLAGSSGLIFKTIKIFQNSKKAKLKYLGQDSAFLHKIRESFDYSKVEVNTNYYDCIVLGGGISGLSSIYHLEKNTREKNKSGNYLPAKYLLLEAQNDIGGNSQSGSFKNGENEISKYPYGAHYLPIPSTELSELNNFLLKSNISYFDPELNQTLYNPEYLIHSPETKLLYLGRWHDGLIPFESLNQEELLEIAKFNEIIHKFRIRVGSDNKNAFSIPISNSSRDEDLLELDKISFKDFLESQQLNSKFLHWFVNYATKDDYGCEYNETSAWAGIHYFASRPQDESSSTNKHQPDLLTWPEGNGFLVKKFKEQINSEVRCNCLILQVAPTDDGNYLVYYLDRGKNKIIALKTKSIISSLPHFINKRIFSSSLFSNNKSLPNLETDYTPWLVANLNIETLPAKYKNIPWDSISFYSDSLGFVRADHQNLTPKNTGAVLSYYLPYSKNKSNQIRHDLSETSLEKLGDTVIKELSKFYPGLENEVSQIDFWIWGHAMNKPKPGNMRQAVLNDVNSVSNSLYLAHTDYSGISVFEEAFYQGVRAAEQIAF